jgi:cation transport regulator ChaC
MWIFGYGSIVWRPNFEYEEKTAGYVKGWVRRFHQKSVHHRGTAKDPGRVATLVPKSDGRVWGVAYRINTAQKHKIIEQLNVREKDGYTTECLEVRPVNDEQTIEEARAYIATPENPNWAGREREDVIAQHIVGSEGVSGENIEYLLQLAEKLRQMEADASHVYELERLVQELKN